MPLTKMEHFLVLTGDLDGTRDFYCRVLGMTDGFRPPLGFPGYWLYLGDTACIHVAEWDTYTAHSKSVDIPVSVPAAGTGSVDHIAFNATDYDELLASLDRNGVKATRNIANPNGLRQVFLLDPNGVKIEINIWEKRPGA
ncbi:MAG TPA: VOC family protein [Steroidobacteraceae bacterium]|jgi:catechol 2,3-dioxygenase-like lactoylglutathione lyase family enzyme|nr:VOC family protein [Steroidobacteraceae bacterium]